MMILHRASLLACMWHRVSVAFQLEARRRITDATGHRSLELAGSLPRTLILNSGHRSPGC
jgi:hypothetical protein